MSGLSFMVEPLLTWYDANARVLPWRDNPTPYRVWISEIMLQQTRVEAVKPYFERFVHALPDIPPLAAADEELLLKLWEGLGYYNRVRNLKKAAVQVMEQWGGRLPEDYKQLETLPGIGFYTAGSISSIAFDRPVPCVDGNVLRVITRLTACGDDIGKAATKTKIFEWIGQVLPPVRAGDVNQSLMELGATVCLPNAAPLCGRCPLQSWCKAHLAGEEERYPVKQKKKQRKVQDRTVFLLFYEDKVGLCRRPETGLLRGMWEFFCVEGRLDGQQAQDSLRERGLSFSGLQPLPDAKHIFTHIEWHMTGFSVTLEKPADGVTFVTGKQLEADYALPSAFRTYTAAAKQRLSK